MVSKKKTNRAEQTTKELVETVKRTASKSKGTAGRKPQIGKIVNVRIDPVELENLKKTFNEYGETLSGGLKRAAYYVMQELKAGRLDMTKAGIFKVG